MRHLPLAGEARTGKDGIRFNSLAYIAPKLHGRSGQRVQIRYMPHDDRSIEVYLGGTHLCTAYPATRLSPEQTQAFLENAAGERERLSAERRKASARARAELAPAVATTDRQSRSWPMACQSRSWRSTSAITIQPSRCGFMHICCPAPMTGPAG